jgi:hypothetical protein
MDKESFITKSFFGPSPAFTNDSRIFDSISERIKSSSMTSPFFSTQYLPSPLLSGEITQGEMCRFKKSSKELNIPRWCVLTLNTFKYYKSQFSAICEEKPLFSLSTNVITSVKIMCNHREYAIEIVTGEDELSLSPLSFKVSMRSNATLSSERHLMSKPRHLIPKIGRYTKPVVREVCMPSPSKRVMKSSSTVRGSRNSWTSRENMMYLTEERLIFMVKTKEELGKWEKAFKNVPRIEVVRENN